MAKLERERAMSIPDEYIYTPSTTDVTLRWRKKYKWVPPSEQKSFRKKWADFKAQASRSLEDLAPIEDPVYDMRKQNQGRVLQWKK